MNASFSGHPRSSSKAAQDTSDDGGPLINGRPALTIAEVESWFRSVHLLGLNEQAVTKVTQQLNHAAFLRFMWAPEFAQERKANPSEQRMRRVADALATLRSDLPEMLHDSRAVNSQNDLSLTDALLNLVVKHQPIIDTHKKTRGRPNNRAGNLAANIGRMVEQLSDPDRVTKKALDAFVAKAMAWLSQGAAADADAAISKNRRRRARRRTCS